MKKEKIGILGGGLAGLSMAYFLKENSVTVIEKNKIFGGLARSFKKNDVTFDIGPHIIFSKNEAVLKFMNTISENQQPARSNQIFHNGKFVKYPFENHLAQIKNTEEIQYCLNAFINNPYEKMSAQNMLAFFLKTFGEGITRTYLQPYNEKIWKFDPSVMDVQMVERIPKPPKQDIINSAKGKFSEGYLHQQYFTYPKHGGTQSIIDGIIRNLKEKGTSLFSGDSVVRVQKSGKGWKVNTEKNSFFFDRIINCMPIHEFAKVLTPLPSQIMENIKDLKYNSIYIVIINVKNDSLGNTFATMLHQKNTIFHRLSKLDFMKGEYNLPNSSTIMLEITFRDGDIISKMSKQELTDKCTDDLIKVGFIKNKMAVNFSDIKKEKYAYVIYDLNHRKNIDPVLEYLQKNKIESIGRFAEFEYLNMDKVIEHSIELAKKLN